MLKLATKFAPEPIAFDTAREAGFRCAELWLNASYLARWRSIARLARSYSFEYTLHCPNEAGLSAETLHNLAALYRELDGRCLVIHQPQYDRHSQEIQKLVPSAPGTPELPRNPALNFAVENHELDPADIESWAGRNSGLALDVEHFWWLTWNNAPLPELLARLREFLQKWHPKLQHVHLPGYVPGYAQHRPMYCARELVFAVLSLLAEFHFEGQIVSETDLDYQTPNDLRMDVLLFETWQGLTSTLPGESL